MNENPRRLIDGIEFPLRLNSELEEVTIADNIHIRRLDNETRSKILGIQEAKFDENGRIKSYVHGLFDPFGKFGTALDQFDTLYSSNYVVTLETYKQAVDFNFALKLLGSSCSALFIGHAPPKTTYFISPPCYYGVEPLAFGISEVQKMTTLLKHKCGSTNPKLSLLAEMYVYAMSVAPRKESRFVELSVILEMLLLPTSSSELSYRFSLRMAKFFQKEWSTDPIETYKLGQSIYKARSRLVHSGQCSELMEVGPKIEECVRVLLSAYVCEPKLFDETALDALCLSN